MSRGKLMMPSAPMCGCARRVSVVSVISVVFVVFVFFVVGRLLSIIVASTSAVECWMALAEANAEADVVFEIGEGSFLVDEWGVADDFCIGGGSSKVPVLGQFVMSMEQSSVATGGMLDDIEIVSAEGNEYVVSGAGSYTESCAPDSQLAEPPNVSSMSARLEINGVKTYLDQEPAGVNGLKFPRIGQSIYSTSFGQRHCYTLSMVAAPSAADMRRFFRRGDADGDGDRNVTDAILILEYLFGGHDRTSCLDSMDVNDDEVLDLGDAVWLLEYLFMGRDLPPVPSTFCGVDPAGDELGCEGQSACVNG